MHFGLFYEGPTCHGNLFLFWIFSVNQESMLGCLYLLLSSPVLESMDFTASNNLHGVTDRLSQSLCPLPL